VKLPELWLPETVFSHQRLPTDPNIGKVELCDDVSLNSREHRQARFKDPTQFGACHLIHAVMYAFVVNGQPRTDPSAKYGYPVMSAGIAPASSGAGRN
jgi:hypothetical protein